MLVEPKAPIEERLANENEVKVPFAAETTSRLRNLLEFVSCMHLDDIDLHRKLFGIAVDFACDYPAKHHLRHFYSEVADGSLSSEWLQKSDEEKTTELDAELDRLASRPTI